MIVEAPFSLDRVRSIVSVCANNAREYHGIEGDLAKMGVSMEFSSTYTAY